MPLLTCIVYIILLVVIAGVLVWALTQLPLDATIKEVGRVVIIVLFIFMLILFMMQCFGYIGFIPRPELPHR